MLGTATHRNGSIHRTDASYSAAIGGWILGGIMIETETFSRAHDASLRRALRDDVASMAHVYVRSQQRVGTAADRHGITYDAVEQWMLKALLQDEIWLLEREHREIVGLVAMTRNELDVLDVDPHLQGRGYGTRLIELAKAKRPGGLVARVSQRRGDASRFLRHHGFVPVGAAVGGVETLVWGAMRSTVLRGQPSHL